MGHQKEIEMLEGKLGEVNGWERRVREVGILLGEGGNIHHDLAEQDEEEEGVVV